MKRMSKSDRVRRARERSEREMANDPTVKLLKERIAYHQARLAEEKAARGETASP
jgi:hypothetical protein